ncbi:hypothetical protein SCHAM137S_01734 [Streptomyces chartreusis]
MVHLDALYDVSLEGEAKDESGRPVRQRGTDRHVELVEPQLVSVVGPFGHRQTCHLAHGVHAVTHVVHMVGMVLVIRLVHVGRVIRRLLLAVAFVSGMSDVVVLALVLGCRSAVLRVAVSRSSRV